MKCKEYKRLIQKDIYGEISEDKKRVLMTHLNACQDCRNAYRQFEEVFDLLDNHASIEGNNDLTQRIMAAALQLEKVSPRRKSYSFEVKLASSFICTGVVVLVTNIMALQNNIFFAEGVQKAILSFNDLVAGICSKLSQFQMF